ncbi:hypothetical protein [Methylobrevis pamukkalensis]|uniref:Anti-sigma factor NepR domain-containing protein n=1 Tax=Methylobrevis pamukkalensis TaxID=1439726 RepID=A0A1E3H2R1_9HYPH|nr:hypothetical protein [Methylobrevis pamukkalensis]ODN70096.1 hypothetical protein A6302_02575 [Methylobrevis pamukkalensis]
MTSNAPWKDERLKSDMSDLMEQIEKEEVPDALLDLAKKLQDALRERRRAVTDHDGSGT